MLNTRHGDREIPGMMQLLVREAGLTRTIEFNDDDSPGSVVTRKLAARERGLLRAKITRLRNQWRRDSRRADD